MNKSNSFPLRRSKTADEVLPICTNSPMSDNVHKLNGNRSNKSNKVNKQYKKRKAVHFAMHSSKYSSQYDSDIDHNVHLSHSHSSSSSLNNKNKTECIEERSCFPMKLEACSSIQNISYILGLYHSWIRSKRAVFKKANDGMYDRIHDKNSKIKNRTQLLNDFNHILDEHTKSNRDLEIVQKYIINTASCGPCILKKGQTSCTIITRHLRDTKKEEKNRDIKTNKFFGYKESSEIVTQQLLDTIHSFIYHSFDTLRFTEYEQKQIDDLCTNPHLKKNNGNDSYFLNAAAIKKAQEIIAKKKKMVQLICKYDPYKANKKFSSDVHVNNDYNDTEYDEKYNMGHNRENTSSVTWDMNVMNAMETNQIEVDTADTLMSVYSFGKEFVYNKANDISPFHLLIKPKYNDIRDELLNNKIYRVQKSDYNDSYEKALIAFTTDKAKKMKRRKLDDDYDKINYSLNDNNNLFITLPHLLCIIFYTDYSNLCFSFSQTYRKKTINEKWSSVVRRHSEYYHWGLLLKQSVECFGIIAKGSTSKLRKKNTFYHGLNQELAFTTFVAQFYGPTSFTDELGIAQTFAKDEGIILSLQPHRQYPSLYFDCKWLSLHPAESEKLFIGGQNPLYIFTIITVSYPQTNHRKCLVAMMHISQMIGIESHDVHLKFKNDHKKYVKMLIDIELDINNQNNYDDIEYNKYMIDSFHIFCQSVETAFIDPNHILFDKMPEIFKTDDGIPKMEIFRKLFPNAREFSICTMDYDKIKCFHLKEHSKHIFQDSEIEEWEDGLLTLSPNISSAISLKSTDDEKETDNLTQELMDLVAKYEENEQDEIIEMDEKQKQQEINQLNQLNQWYQNDQIMYQNDNEYAADDETEDDLINNMMIIHQRSDKEQHLYYLRDQYIDNHTGLGRPNKPCKFGQKCKWHNVEEDDFSFLTLSQKLHGYFYHNKEYTEYEATVRSQKYCEQHFKKEIRKSLLITPLTAYNDNDTMSVLPLLSRPSSVTSISASFESRKSTVLLQRPPLLQKRQSSIAYTNDIFDKPSVEYHSTIDQIAPPQHNTLCFGNSWEIKLKEAKFKDPKQEILENSFNRLEKYQWNDILKEAIGVSKKREAKLIDLSIKLIVALKLYTDYDKLQDEFILSYRHEFRKQRIKRQQQFFYWNKLLEESCGRSQDVIIDKLFRGVNKAVTTSSFSGTFWGPVSCTTQFNQLNSFIGCDGTILEMYPTYSRRGLKVHWLSMFPYEKEVLYFNTSFQISNIYYKQSLSPSLTSNRSSGKAFRFSIIGKSDTFLLDNNDLNEKINKNDFMEKAILRALQLINTESHIISFSDINDNKDIDQISAGFNQLDGSEQIAVLYLLYLEYRNEWNTFWDELNENMKFAFAKYRDQFISLAINVTAVRMDKLSMMLQHFFCANQDEYKFPIKGSTVQDIDNCKLEIQDTFQANKSLNFGTIVRLFPNAQQLSINGDNFDWTLESFVQFVDQYQLDYQNVALQDIHIKFEPQYPYNNNIYDDEPGSQRNSANNTPSLNSLNHPLFNIQATTPEDLQASKRLNQYKDESRKNIHKLMKLGWKFVSASHITRIGFEPLPELPFFMTFVSNDKMDKMYYRTYSQLLLNKEAFLIMDSSHSHSNNVSDNDGDGDEKYPESRITTPGISNMNGLFKADISYSRQGSNDSYYDDDEEGGFPDIEYQNYEDIDISSLEDIGSTVLMNRSNSNEKMNKLSMKMKPGVLKYNLSAPHRVSKYYHLNKSMSKKPSINIKEKEIISKFNRNRRETQTEGKIRNFSSNVVVDYNPRNCTLSTHFVNHTLSYKKKLIEELKWKKHHPKIKPINNKLKESFNKYCNMVNALVLDPMPYELQPIFMKDISKGIPSFESILSIFPNISDLFLRDTQLKLKICYTFKSYLNQNENNCKLQRIFFCKKQNQRLNKRDENTVKSTLNALGWDLNLIEQMIFLKEPGTPTNVIVTN